jgi:hypothetical protein
MHRGGKIRKENASDYDLMFPWQYGKTGGDNMPEQIKRVSRSIVCPDGKECTEVLIEWTVVKGKKVLRQIDCSNPMLSNYGLEDCKWTCWDRLCKRD